MAQPPRENSQSLSTNPQVLTNNQFWPFCFLLSVYLGEVVNLYYSIGSICIVFVFMKLIELSFEDLSYNIIHLSILMNLGSHIINCVNH